MSYVRLYRGREVIVSTDEASPNVVYLDRDAATELIQISRDRYEVRRGLCLLGSVTFWDQQTCWGWRYQPHTYKGQPSRKLHPNAEASIRSRMRFAPFGARENTGARARR